MAISPQKSKPNFLGIGWAFPVNQQAGCVLTAEGAEDIKQSILLILQTNKGERIMLPEFGSQLNELVFAPANAGTCGLAAFYTKSCLSQWEPRIIVSNVEANFGNPQNSLILINIDYIIRSKNTPNNLIYPFYLQTHGSKNSLSL